MSIVPYPRRGLQVLTLLSLALVPLVACNDPAPAASKTMASLNEQVKQPSPPSQSAQSVQPVTIEFWHAMTGEPQKTLEKIASDYNALTPALQVKLVNQGNYTSLQQKLMAAAKTKTTPTLAQTFMDWNAVFEQNGLVANLSPFINDPKSGWSREQLEDIYHVFRAENTINGNLYSLPFNKSATLLFYNKTLLDTYQIQVPTTWDELQEAARKLTMQKPSGTGKQVGMGFENSMYAELQNYVVQAGGNYINLKSDKPFMEFNSPEGKYALSFLRSMLEPGYARLAGEDGFMTEPFGRGDVAMFVGSSAGISFINKAVGTKFEWFAALPPKGKEAVANISGTNISMFTNTTAEQKQAAWDFMKFLLTKENTALWAQNTGYLPVRASANDLVSYKQYLSNNPVQGVAEKQLNTGKILTRVLDALVVEPLVAKEVEAVLLGKKSVEQGLADAEKAANTELAAIKVIN